MNLPAGSGVQLTPWGFAALGDASGVQAEGDFGAKIPDAPRLTETDLHSIGRKLDEYTMTGALGKLEKKLNEATAHYVKPLRPADVLKLARRRVREIRAELKRHAALQKELTQLENMLSAAKPLASVRSLSDARQRQA